MLRNYFSQYSFCVLTQCPLRSYRASGCCVNEIALSRYLEIIRVGRVLEVMRIPRRKYLRYSNWNIIFRIVDGCYFFIDRQLQGIDKRYFHLYVKNGDSQQNAVCAAEALIFSLGEKEKEKERGRKRVVGEVSIVNGVDNDDLT